MRGVRCNVCNALGEHYSSHCPYRGRVGVPAALQPPVGPGASPDPQPAEPSGVGVGVGAGGPGAGGPGAGGSGAGASSGGGGAVAAVPGFPPAAILGPMHLSAQQLYTAVVTRSDVPRWCSCCACGLIAAEAVWCAQCNAVACARCMTPVGPESTLCPVCGTTSGDDIHAVAPLRQIIDTLFIAMAEEVDAGAPTLGAASGGAAAPAGPQATPAPRFPGGPRGR